MQRRPKILKERTKKRDFKRMLLLNGLNRMWDVSCD